MIKIGSKVVVNKLGDLSFVGHVGYVEKIRTNSFIVLMDGMLRIFPIRMVNEIEFINCPEYLK